MAYVPKRVHKLKEFKKYEPEKPKNWLKDQSHAAIYSSSRWIKLRLMILSQTPTCKMCTKPAKYIDHILPISQGGEIWNENNLQPLCISCNARKTAKQKLK